MFDSLMLACIRLFDYTFFVLFVFTPLGGSRYEIIHEDDEGRAREGASRAEEAIREVSGDGDEPRYEPW